MSAMFEQQGKTRMFARALGPFFCIVPAAIVWRASDMGMLFVDFAVQPIWPWVLGALLLMTGSIIIAFHQYWRSPAAIMVSLLGWFLALRGIALLFAPDLIIRVGNAAMGETTLVRAGFGALSLVGLYLIFVGWIASPPRAS